LNERIDAERAVLGAILASPAAFPVVNDYLREDDFYLDSHREIFASCERLFEVGSGIDLITVVNDLRKRDLLDRAGGVSAISSLVDMVPDLGNIEYYCEIVSTESNRSMARQLAIQAADRLEHTGDVKGEIDGLTASLIGMLSEHGASKPEQIGAVATRQGSSLLKAGETGVAGGMKTGIPSIDGVLLPLRPGNVYAIGGGTGAGKSAFVDQITDHMASNGARCLSFVLEMTREQRINRIFARRCRIPNRELETKGAREDQAHLITMASRELSELKWLIDDTRGLKPIDIMARARAASAKWGGVDLITVDYLQLVEPPRSLNSREREVAEITRSFTQMAGKLNCAIVLLSQFSRDHLKNNREPEMHDFRESGTIEHDAFVCLLLHAEKHPKTGDPPPHRRVLVKIEKQRQGPPGARRELIFTGDFQEFESAPERRRP
jgi:replicative DNA helicase